MHRIIPYSTLPPTPIRVSELREKRYGVEIKNMSFGLRMPDLNTGKLKQPRCRTIYDDDNEMMMVVVIGVVRTAGMKANRKMGRMIW